MSLKDSLIKLYLPNNVINISSFVEVEEEHDCTEIRKITCLLVIIEAPSMENAKHKNGSHCCTRYQKKIACKHNKNRISHATKNKDESGNMLVDTSKISPIIADYLCQ